jgi:hypothetical protein
MKKGLAVLVVLLSGCDLYFGGDDDPCAYGQAGGAKPDIAAQELRNPETGVCEYGGGGGGWGCDDRCGACPPYEDQQPVQDWGACYGSCYGLAESACFTASGCYAAYLDDPAADGKPQFWGCWNTAPSGPVRGSCTSLSGYECSRHDDCIAVYNGKSDATDTAYEGTSFQRCAAEYSIDTPACANVNCGPGYTCEEQCSAGNDCKPVCMNTLTCASVDCGPGYTCSTACSTDANGKTTCGPLCVASSACEALTDETACLARTDCTPVYDGQDCTCYPDHCECKILTYERCE